MQASSGPTKQYSLSPIIQRCLSLLIMSASCSTTRERVLSCLLSIMVHGVPACQLPPWRRGSEMQENIQLYTESITWLTNEKAAFYYPEGQSLRPLVTAAATGAVCTCKTRAHVQGNSNQRRSNHEHQPTRRQAMHTRIRRRRLLSQIQSEARRTGALACMALWQGWQ